MQQTGFISKVFIASTALSILIKYGGSYLSIPATTINVLIIVFVPTIVMAIALSARYAKAKRELSEVK